MDPFDDRRRREIDEEIRVHLDARVAHLVARGMAPDQARAEAVRRFGDLAAGRAALYAQAASAARWRGIAAVSSAWMQDLRHAARGLRRQPGFVAGVVGVLTLGIGVNLAVFGIADRVLLRAPEQVERPGELRSLETVVVQPGRDPIRVETFSFPDAETFDAAAALPLAVGTLPQEVANGDGRALSIAYIDGELLPLLGLRPAAGRFFDPAEAEPGAGSAVAIVSFDYWQRELGGRPTGGIDLVVAGRPHTVIGVTPRGFTGIDLDPVDAWLPLGVANFGRGSVNGVTIPWYRSEMMRGLRLVGRVAPDASLDVVGARLQAALEAADAARGREGRRVALQPVVPMGGRTALDSTRRLIGRLAGVAALVLAIAIANATHLLLARGLRRRRELATRLALGASRGRVWRLLVAESVAVAVLSGLAATLAGGWVATALRNLILPDARWTATMFDARTMMFAAALSVLAGLVAGIAPALQATSPDLMRTIRAGRAPGAGRPRRLRGSLLIAQSALSLVLLTTAGLLVASLIRLGTTPLGFAPAGLVSVSLPAAMFADQQVAGAVEAPALAERLRIADDRLDVAFASVAPFGASKVVDILVPGSDYQPPSNRDVPRVNDVSDGFFAVMGSSLVRGRGFRSDDAVGEPVTVVNETMARNYWGGAPPPGACVLQIGSPCARVIGVVEDVVERPGEPAVMRYYRPLDRHRDTPRVLVARTEPSRVGDLVARAKAALPAGQRVTIDVVAERVRMATAPWRTAAWLFVGLGTLALLLACAGIYSIISYGASERMHEFGVRVSLGATRADLVRLVLGGGLRLAVAGGVIGVLAALAGARLIAALLFDVSPFDVRVYAVAFAGMTGAAIAAMLPAVLRASRVDAVVALREE